MSSRWHAKGQGFESLRSTLARSRCGAEVPTRRQGVAGVLAPPDSAPWSSLPLPLRSGQPAPVGWPERRFSGLLKTRQLPGHDGLDKGTLAAALIGLMRARKKPSPIHKQAYGPPPLVKSTAWSGSCRIFANSCWRSGVRAITAPVRLIGKTNGWSGRRQCYSSGS